MNDAPNSPLDVLTRGYEKFDRRFAVREFLIHCIGVVDIIHGIHPQFIGRSDKRYKKGRIAPAFFVINCS